MSVHFLCTKETGKSNISRFPHIFSPVLSYPILFIAIARCLVSNCPVESHFSFWLLYDIAPRKIEVVKEEQTLLCLQRKTFLFFVICFSPIDDILWMWPVSP